MTPATLKQIRATVDAYPSLYDRTGNVADLNTLLVPRDELYLLHSHMPKPVDEATTTPAPTDTGWTPEEEEAFEAIPVAYCPGNTPRCKWVPNPGGAPGSRCTTCGDTIPF